MGENMTFDKSVKFSRRKQTDRMGNKLINKENSKQTDKTANKK